MEVSDGAMRRWQEEVEWDKRYESYTRNWRIQNYRHMTGRLS